MRILIRFMGVRSPAAVKIPPYCDRVGADFPAAAGAHQRFRPHLPWRYPSGGRCAGNRIYHHNIELTFALFIGGISYRNRNNYIHRGRLASLVTASAITEDFYHNKIRPNASPSELMWVSRICVISVALIAVFIATDQDSTVLGLVSYAWAGFGSAFGPLVLCSLFWKRTNKYGAYAGIIVGGLTSIIWAQLSGGIFDLYEIVPGFFFGLIAIVVVSLLTPAPESEVANEFESYKTCEE